MPMISEIIRNDDGSLPAYAHPGGYPIIYYFEDGGACCPNCANGKNKSIAYIGTPPDGIDDPLWNIVSYDILYENDEECSNCYKVIESAYGNVDE